MDKYIPYVRKSSSSKSQDEATFETQLAEIEKYAAVWNYELVMHPLTGKPFTETGSGTTMDREEFLEAIAYMQDSPDIKGIIVYDISRYCRDVEGGLRVLREAFLSNGKALVSTQQLIKTDTPAGKFMFQMFLMFSEYEVGVINQRTSAGKQMTKERGGYMGGKVPYGYQLVKRTVPGSSVERQMLEPDPKTYKDVVMIRELHDNEGWTFFKIMTLLNKERQAEIDAGKKPRHGVWTYNLARRAYARKLPEEMIG